MRREEFLHILLEAMAGDHEALEKILNMYQPMIDRHCYINGVFDEDLRQYIWIHIALNISKFPL